MCHVQYRRRFHIVATVFHNLLVYRLLLLISTIPNQWIQWTVYNLDEIMNFQILSNSAIFENSEVNRLSCFNFYRESFSFHCSFVSMFAFFVHYFVQLLLVLSFSVIAELALIVQSSHHFSNVLQDLSKTPTNLLPR